MKGYRALHDVAKFNVHPFRRSRNLGLRREQTAQSDVLTLTSNAGCRMKAGEYGASGTRSRLRDPHVRLFRRRNPAPRQNRLDALDCGRAGLHGYRRRPRARRFCNQPDATLSALPLAMLKIALGRRQRYRPGAPFDRSRHRCRRGWRVCRTPCDTADHARPPRQCLYDVAGQRPRSLDAECRRPRRAAGGP